MKISRRDKLKIYGDLLLALNEQNMSEKIVFTKLQVQIEVPFDRLKGYISELYNLGLIKSEADPRLTKKGLEYLSGHQKVLEFMRRMGLTYE